MNREEAAFKSLLMAILALAARQADKVLGFEVPRRYEIELHDAISHPRMLFPDDAVAAIYASPERLFRVIDTKVIRVSERFTTVRMSFSDEAIGAENKIEKHPGGCEPFRLLTPKDIQTDSLESHG